MSEKKKLTIKVSMGDHVTIHTDNVIIEVLVVPQDRKDMPQNVAINKEGEVESRVLTPHGMD